jgi:hypothetical protein
MMNVHASVRARMRNGIDMRTYRIQFTIDRKGGLTGLGVEMLDRAGKVKHLSELNGRRDLVEPVRDRFLKTEAYVAARRELGWE